MNRKLLVSVLAIGVLLSAMIGGTYAVFTDTEYNTVEFQAGTIDIELSGPAATLTTLNPLEYDDWKPGDIDSFDLVVTNTGNNIVWVQIYIYPVDGEPNFWDFGKYWIEAEEEDYNRWVVDPGDSLTLPLWVEFPQFIGNQYQGATGELMILVVAKQYRNKFEEGYSCVALENKDTSTWLPILNDNIEGVLCYKVEGDKLLVDLNAYGLTPDAYYQLDLTGGDTGNPIDPGCTTQDDNLAGMSTDLYISGYWNWYTYLEGTCQVDHGGEGVWNYAGVYEADKVQADSEGVINFGAELDAPPAGEYKGIGAHVKLVEGTLPGTSWTGVLNEMDYLSFTVEP